MKTLLTTIFLAALLVSCGKDTETIITNNGPQGVPGNDGTNGEAGNDGQSCSSKVFQGGFEITCGSETNRYLIPISSTQAIIPQNFTSGVPYILNIFKSDVELPDSFTLDALVSNMGGGANGRISLQIGNDYYCYQSQIGTKNFTYKGRRVDSQVCSRQGSGFNDFDTLVAPTIDVNTINLILEHRSDLASRWLLTRPIELYVDNSQVLDIN